VPRGQPGHAEVYYRPITLRKFAVGIGKELEVQAFGGAELVVRNLILAADAENGSFFPLGNCALPWCSRS